MTEWVIENNVAMPAGFGTPGSTGLVKAMRSMQIGQSMLIPGKKNVREISSSRKCARPLQFRCLVVDGGLRIWRTE